MAGSSYGMPFEHGRDAEIQKLANFGCRLQHPSGAFSPASRYLSEPAEDSGVILVAVGYPFRSFRASAVAGPLTGRSAMPALRLIEGSIGNVNSEGPVAHLMPTHAVWAGLLADWLLYALALLLPVEGAYAVKRWVRTARMARGACVQCGYPLGTGIERCPECGTISGKLPRPNSSRAEEQ